MEHPWNSVCYYVQPVLFHKLVSRAMHAHVSVLLISVGSKLYVQRGDMHARTHARTTYAGRAGLLQLFEKAWAACNAGTSTTLLWQLTRRQRETPTTHRRPLARRSHGTAATSRPPSPCRAGHLPRWGGPTPIPAARRC